MFACEAFVTAEHADKFPDLDAASHIEYYLKLDLSLPCAGPLVLDDPSFVTAAVILGALVVFIPVYIAVILTRCVAALGY